MTYKKVNLALAVVLASSALLFPPTKALATQIQSLGGSTVSSQTFVNDTNVTMSTNIGAGVHTLGWTGILSVLKGGTGANSFSNGSLLFYNGSTFAQNNSNLFWDNTNNRLGVGTSSPTKTLDVNGNTSISGDLNVTGNITGNVTVTNVVPYTGATGDVDLGSHNFSASSLTSTGDSTINGLTIGLGAGQIQGNTVLGSNALVSNTGNSNTAIGNGALNANINSNDNTAVGQASLYFNTAEQNTAVGSQALRNTTNGGHNSAFGHKALNFNTSGGGNVALGWFSLRQNDSGNGNVAVGAGALENNTSGSNNVVIGTSAVLSSTNGSNSIVIGEGVTGAGDYTAVVGNQDVTDAYFGSSSANSSVHAKKLYLGSSSVPGCIVIGDVNGGVNYVTFVSGVMTVSSTPPLACQ